MSRDWDNEYVAAESAEESLAMARAHSQEQLREAAASGIPLLHKPVSPGQVYRKMVEIVTGF